MHISDFIGIPFKAHGRTKDACDCWGLVRLYYHHMLNISLPLYDECYASVDDQEAINAAIIQGKSNWKEVSATEDAVILLRMLNMSTHVGILLEPNVMLHASKNIGSHIVKLSSPLWNNRVLGYFKYAKSDS